MAFTIDSGADFKLLYFWEEAAIFSEASLVTFSRPWVLVEHSPAFFLERLLTCHGLAFPWSWPPPCYTEGMSGVLGVSVLILSVFLLGSTPTAVSNGLGLPGRLMDSSVLLPFFAGVCLHYSGGRGPVDSGAGWTGFIPTSPWGS